MHVFFSDLDGTLLNSQKQISPRTLQAVKEYILAGHKFVICSGRPLYSVFHVLDQTDLKIPGLFIISNNGSQIYDYDQQKTCFDYPIPTKDVMHIIDTAREMGIHCQTYSSKTVVCRHQNPEILAYCSETGLVPLFSERLEELIDQDPYKALAISLDDHQRLVALQQTLEPWMKGKYTTVFSNERFLEFIDIRSGKGNAVKRMCSYFHISSQNAYAAGDADNDISMLQAVGHGIAMINGTREVKAISSHVTMYDHDHDGLADIFLQLAKDPA